jgi:PAS domain S-box-containing protein
MPYNLILDNILESLVDSLIVVNLDATIKMVNEAAIRLLGYEKKELIGKPVDIIIEEEAPGVSCKILIGELIKKGLGQNIEKTYRSKDGKRIPMVCSGSIMRDKDENIQGIVIIAKDITERKKMEEELGRHRANLEELIQERSTELEESMRKLRKENAERKRVENSLRESEERFRSLYENSTIGLYRTTPDGRILLANPTTVRMLGYNTFEELAQRNLEKSGFEPSYSRAEFHKRLERDGEVIGLESAWLKKDGSTIYVRESARAIYDKNGKILYYDGTFEDITERKLAEEQIKKSLREKETLLKELYHRTNNNMQMICSLLHLQSNYVKNKQLMEAFNITMDRIRSMALVHEELYKSKDLSVIDLKDYIKALAKNLFNNYGATPDRISLKLDAKSVPITIDTAIPCGLIVNEIISNSLKHAFPEKRKGEIKITLGLTDQEKIELKISDNGIGMPEDFDWRKTSSLGLKIVMNLAETQLDGDVKMSFHHGMEFLIRFKESHPIKRV